MQHTMPGSRSPFSRFAAFLAMHALLTTSFAAFAQSGLPGPVTNGSVAVFASNDLGMHCTDKDFQIFSILPPFNVVHAQAVRRGTAPRLLGLADADLYYAAASSASDPAGAGSINTGSANPSVFKSNFWQLVTGTSQTFGTLSYRSLYPAQPCGVAPCASVLDLFAPLARDVGLPVPDPNALPSLVAHQQRMPAASSGTPANTPQQFARFDVDLAFFRSFPFGQTVAGANWFAADGIPILPVDDAGRTNAYPLMRVAAVAKGAQPSTASNVLGSVDIVLPVASEADCQNCHAALSDATQSPTPVTGRAADFASVTTYANGSRWTVATTANADVPGPEKLLNAAKINILRLHDAKHGAKYIRIDTGASDACLSGTEASCLDRRRSIQCSQCHYTPALDLAQVGPIDEPAAGRFGRQQTRHISMSRAMHGHHGGLRDSGTGQLVFPDMPPPGTPGRAAVVGQVLNDTCYQCHPGKRTQCLRGAMATGGVVCQDCHGNMRQVGNDFTGTFPQRAGSIDLAKRVPWANEPKCQSCHIGDAMSVLATDRSDMIVAGDGVRLLQAFARSAVNQEVLSNIQAPASRFAENNNLYRLSKGHGGLMCKACHGATHAEWPNANPNANDNVAAVQLQGHAGTITECTVCHAAGSLGNTLGGPHGMHPVNDSRFTDGGHGDLAERNRESCRACHGPRGEGSVLSRVAADRVFTNIEDVGTVRFAKGTAVRCDTCHGNPLAGLPVPTPPAAGQPLLVSAILPLSRAARVGATVTAFATVINAGSTTATACGIALASSIPASLGYQITDARTNALSGTPNTPVDVGPGAAQTYVFSLTPAAAFGATDVQLRFSCTNANPATVLTGINTLLLSASNTPTADVIALAATAAGNGIVDVPGTTGTGAFAVASANVGTAATITASADTGAASVPVSLALCQTNPASGACLAPPAASVTTSVPAGATPTFAVFATARGSIPFNPAVNRVFLRFRDSASNQIVGATSVALRGQ
jgi:hypothetical protein